MKVAKGEFIELDYCAIDKETGKMFDVTSEEAAKKNNLLSKNAEYKPVIICIGERQVIPGLDDALIGKEVKQEYTIDITPEEGFGKKDPKLLKLFPAKIFKKENIRPFPGLQIDIDNMRGTVRTVSGGRIVIDFNHPLAGHKLTYKITINKVISDEKSKIESLLRIITTEPKVEIREGSVEIELAIPEAFQKELKEEIQRTIPTIKEVKFKDPIKK